MTPSERQRLQQHLGWLKQFAEDDAEHQKHNYLDNMAHIRDQIEMMRCDFLENTK